VVKSWSKCTAGVRVPSVPSADLPAIFLLDYMDREPQATGVSSERAVEGPEIRSGLVGQHNVCGIVPPLRKCRELGRRRLLSSCRWLVASYLLLRGAPSVCAMAFPLFGIVAMLVPAIIAATVSQLAAGVTLNTGVIVGRVAGLTSSA
jgi:hypothetical protein